MIKDEIKFMMGKCLHLLISDLRSNKIYEGVINFRPTGRSGSHLYSIEFRRLSIFLNLWAGLDSLNKYILGDLEFPSAYKVEYKQTRDFPQNLSIDWVRTIAHWSIGNQQEYIVRLRVLEKSTELAQFIKIILMEIQIHSKHILNDFISHIGKNKGSIYLEMEKDINSFCYNIENKLATEFINVDLEKTDLEILQKIELELVNVLKGDDINARIFSKYNSNIPIFHPKSNMINERLSQLYYWRCQYLECKIWLSEENGFRLDQRSHRNQLYELFCFIEFSDGFRRNQIGHLYQRTFITSNRRAPVFSLGDKYNVYFDDRNDIVPKIGTSNLLSQFKIEPALKNVFVEWFVLDINDYENSIIIDSKNGRWNSREALKVIGYMGTFGVKNGIVIFKNGFNHNVIGGNRICQGLTKISIPGFLGSHLWVLQLIPDSNFEKLNKEVIDILLVNLFKKQPD